MRTGVGEVSVDLGRRRRQTGEIEREPANERARIGVGGGFEAVALDASEHEAVDPVDGPVGPRDGRRGMIARRHIRPVRRVGRTGGDPLRERLLVGRREHVVALGWRHDRVGIGLVDSGDQFALIGVAGDDGPAAAVEFGRGRVAVVEPQAPPAVMLVGPVAGEAVVRQDWADVAGEVGGFFGPLGSQYPPPCGEAAQGHQSRHQPAGGAAEWPRWSRHADGHRCWRGRRRARSRIIARRGSECRLNTLVDGARPRH